MFMNGCTHIITIPLVYIKCSAYPISCTFRKYVLWCVLNIKFSYFQVHEEDDALNVWMYDAVENNGKYTRYNFVCLRGWDHV
jgi:hypothetical protein